MQKISETESGECKKRQDKKLVMRPMLRMGRGNNGGYVLGMYSRIIDSIIHEHKTIF